VTSHASPASSAPRSDGRRLDELRPVRIVRGFSDVAEGSVLIEAGRTRALCTASVEESVPRWMVGSGRGWVSAEYAMQPSSTRPRKAREATTGKRDGRGIEIGRLIGRALRAAVDTGLLGERTIWLDCDVLVADGGTRTACITGAFVALADAVAVLRASGRLEADPVRTAVAAVSVGIVDGVPCLDLPYEEDARAAVDFNVVMTGDGRLVEVQGAAEQGTFDRAELNRLLDLAAHGIEGLLRLQREALAS
jgi:ribonuclease PH